MNAAPNIKIGQPVDALQIERAVIGKRRRGNDIDAFGLLCKFTYGIPLGAFLASNCASLLVPVECSGVGHCL